MKTLFLTNIFNYKKKRNSKEALVFYVAHLVLLIVAAAVLGGILGVASGKNDVEFGKQVGNVVAILGSLGLAFWILNKKKLLNNFMYILLALLAGVLAMVGGGILGLVPAAYLTTR